MNLNLVIGLGYTTLALVLLIGGIVVPLLYTVIPLARANGNCPMHLVWRLVLKLLFSMLMLEKAYIHLHINFAGQMPPSINFEVVDIIVMVGLAIALTATWITHPDHFKSV